MATRSTRNQPFCWQEKKILRLLKANFSGMELVKMKSLYLALTEIDSDFNRRKIKFYTKTISTYSGLSERWIPGGLQTFANFQIIDIIDNRDESGKRTGREIVFTPEKVVQKPTSRKPTIRKPTSSPNTSLEDISFSEYNSLGEDILPLTADAEKKERSAEREDQEVNGNLVESGAANGKAHYPESEYQNSLAEFDKFWLAVEQVWRERKIPFPLPYEFKKELRRLNQNIGCQELLDMWKYYQACPHRKFTNNGKWSSFLKNLEITWGTMKAHPDNPEMLFRDKNRKVSYETAALRTR